MTKALHHRYSFLILPVESKIRRHHVGCNPAILIEELQIYLFSVMTIRKKQADSQVSMGKEQSHRLQFVEIMRFHALLSPFHKTALWCCSNGFTHNHLHCVYCWSRQLHQSAPMSHHIFRTAVQLGIYVIQFQMSHVLHIQQYLDDIKLIDFLASIIRNGANPLIYIVIEWHLSL